ncbi:MAG: Na/Pi symporter [Gammaproteobacteria bacterium]|nr:Na/Pi symporter [Gammaproteobacteria bacterium]
MSPINFIFGLGLFLFGMSQLEYGIRKLSDVRLRGWLRASTGTSVGSVATGVVATALLQSSSMVSLLVLAFASAGLLPLVNAVGIILGANLGTTVTGWVVAILGFKLDLESLALPLLGLSAFAIAFTRRETRPHFSAMVSLGIGLLLFGLGIMKTSMETIPEQWDVALLQGHSPLLYLVFGVLITVVIQSSSAVMMMALAAVNANFIALPEAVALIIGADLGTTSTTVLGSLGGSAIKRQLALAHCVFNLIVDISAFLFLLPLLPYLLSLVHIADPLIGLVAFHSIMNLLGLMAFIPFLPVFSGWIEKLFARHIGQQRSLLERVPTDVVDAALVALQGASRSVVLQAGCNAMRVFNLIPERLDLIKENVRQAGATVESLDFDKGYEHLKRQEGEILRFSAQIQLQPLDEQDVIELERLLRITRRVIYCNKTLKDIQQDLRELRLNPVPVMNELYDLQRSYYKSSYQRLLDLLLDEHSREFLLEEFEQLDEENDQHYNMANEMVRSRAALASSDTTLISLQLNVNRETRLAYRQMLRAVRSLSIDQTIAGNISLQSNVPVNN